MKKSSKIALGVAAGVVALAALKKRAQGTAGVGKVKDKFVIGKVLSTRYRNTSYYGNPSYYVTLETKSGDVWHCYTAPNAGLGYEIENGELKREWRAYKYTDGARGCALHYEITLDELKKRQ